VLFGCPIGHVNCEDGKEGIVPVNPTSMLAYLISEKRYRVYFYAATVAYGVLFSFLTGTIVYRDILPPYAGFVPPATLVAFCCGAPLYVPTISVYLTSNLGLYLLPVQLILLLVATALSTYQPLFLALSIPVLVVTLYLRELCRRSSVTGAST